jgi:hypothetical protein
MFRPLLQQIAIDLPSMSADRQAEWKQLVAEYRTVRRRMLAFAETANITPSSRKLRGQAVRTAWIAERGRAGIPISGTGATHTINGAELRIATAWLSASTNRWEITIPDTQLPDLLAVLLCDQAGLQTDLVLPAAALAGAWPHFSRSTTNTRQVKLHFQSKGPQLLLRVPHRQPIDVTVYGRCYGPLEAVYEAQAVEVPYGREVAYRRPGL